MTTPLGPEFHFSSDDLVRALSGHGDGLDLIIEEDDHDELQAVARRIAGNHVDVLANFARAVFAHRATRSEYEQFSGALASLLRLAQGAGDLRQVQLLERMRRDIEERLKDFGSRNDRNRFLPRLQRFIDGFASWLDGADAERLDQLIHFEPGTLPLLSELEGIHGIGPKRLARLYCCGLYTVEAVAPADAIEVAQVTGLPSGLSEDVVAATRRWAEERRAASIQEIRMRIREFERMALALPDGLPASLLEEGQTALRELEAVLTRNRRRTE